MTPVELKLSLDLAKVKIDKIKKETYFIYFLTLIGSFIFTRIPTLMKQPQSYLWLYFVVNFVVCLIIFKYRSRVHSKAVKEALFYCPYCNESISRNYEQRVVDTGKCASCGREIINEN